jgi:anti-sigma B factor antagonist
MEMNIKKDANGVAVVHLSDQLDTAYVPVFKERMEAEFGYGTKKYVLDLTDVNFLDSTGLGALVSVLRRAEAAGGGVRLVWPKPEASRQLLRVVRFDKVFDIKETVADAVSAL